MWPFDLLSTSKKAVDIADKLIDGAVSGLDALVFTEEEKAEHGLKIMAQKTKVMDLWLKMQSVTANENTAKSITRRILAVMVITVFLGFLIFAVGVFKFYPDWAKFSLQAAGNLSTGFTAIIIFYYGYYAVGNILAKKKES